MAKVRLYPHRTASPSSVTFGEWWIERSDARTPLPELLTGWDYASEEVVGILMSIDAEQVLASTGQRALDDLEVLLLADCPSAQRRVVARHRLGEITSQREVAFDLVLPAGLLAGSIKLSAHLVVARDLDGAGPRVAARRGSRLISSKARSVALEGDASRFPIEPGPFSELGLPAAPWTVHASFDDLSASFMGAVRLLVNTEHKVGRMLLESASADQVSGLAMADVIRLLVASLADRVSDLASLEPEEGSIVQVVESMCEFFLGYGLRSAIQLYLSEPIQFDLLLQERVRPLAKAFG